MNTDTIIRLAQDFTAGGERARRSIGLTRLLMILLRSGDDLAVEDLLCEVDRLSRASDSHDDCCQGECECARPNTTFVHPTCEHCDDVRVEKLHDTVDALLAMIPADERERVA